MKTLARIALAFPIFLSVVAGAKEMKESVTWKNIVSHPAPSPVIGRLVPIQSSLDRPSLWSVGCETLDRDYSNFNNYKKYVGQTGVGYARLQSGWAKTEKEKGVYDFEWLDAHVDGLLAQGVKPWICLCYGNPIYSEHGLNLNAAIFPEGEIMDAWNRYVAQVVKRYKGKVTMYEVWNEPDGGRNGDSYDAYASLFVNTARTIRKYDKDVKIAAFGICSPDKKYIRKSLEKMKELGGIEYIDFITFHGYWPIPERLGAAVRNLRSDAKGYSQKIELLQGESGCPGQLEYGHAMNGIEWSEYSQAKWDLRHMMMNFSMGIPSSVFTMVDLNYGWMMQSFGLIRMNLKNEPVYKRPKFHAVQHVTALLTSEFTSCADVRAGRSSVSSLMTVGLEKEGRKVGCILWKGGERPGDSLNRTLADINIEGLDELEDPVYVDLLTGFVHDISRIVVQKGNVLETKGLPVWDSPIVIIEKKLVRYE